MARGLSVAARAIVSADPSLRCTSILLGRYPRQPTSNIFFVWARMHHKVVGNFGSEADVRSLHYRRFRFNETSDVGA